VSEAVRSDLEDDELLTPGEVARRFGVDPKTVTRWASAGKLSPLRTLGGHRRYRASEVDALLERSVRGEAPQHSGRA
jgi:excisionase family DNA binding protein